ncbi:MAG: flagellar hook-length control protein FliK [Leptospirales bacterium]
MSTLPLNFPAKGKVTPVADPSTPDKAASVKSGSKKKGRAGDPPSVSRRKPFRQHLDQAMGKAVPVSIPPVPDPASDPLPKPDPLQSRSFSLEPKNLSGQMKPKSPVIPVSGDPKAFPEFHSGKGPLPFSPEPAKTGKPAETVRPLLSPILSRSFSSSGPSSVPARPAPETWPTSLPVSPAKEIPAGIPRPVSDGRFRIKEGLEPFSKQSGSVPAQIVASSGEIPVLGPMLASSKKPERQRETLSRSSSPFDGKESASRVRFPDKDTATPGGTGIPAENAPAGEKQTGLSREGGDSRESLPDHGKEGNDLSGLPNQGVPSPGGAIVSEVVPGKGDPLPVRVPQFQERVAESVRSGGGQIMLDVHPPALGPVRVTVRIDPRSKAVEVHLDVKDASVRKALEGKEGDLRQLLKSEGFSMNRLDVSVSGGAGGEGISSGMNLTSSPSDPQPGGMGVPSDGSGPFRPDLSGGTTLFSGESPGGRGGGSTAPGSGERESPPGDRGTVLPDPGPKEEEDGGYHRIA